MNKKFSLVLSASLKPAFSLLGMHLAMLIFSSLVYNTVYTYAGTGNAVWGILLGVVFIAGHISITVVSLNQQAEKDFKKRKNNERYIDIGEKVSDRDLAKETVPYKGFLVGLLSEIPGVILIFAAGIFSSESLTLWVKLLYSPYSMLLDSLFGNDFSVWLYMNAVLVTVLIAALRYKKVTEYLVKEEIDMINEIKELSGEDE